MDLPELIEFLTQQPLLALAIASIFIAVLGGMLRGALPKLGGFVRGMGNLGLIAALLLTIAQVTRFTTGSDLALPQLGMPGQTVEGGETRVPIDRDGHFWLTASVNGVERRFLVDTGATLTAISPRTAQAAQLEEKAFPQAIMMRTANGTVQAQLTTIDELRFGNVVARDLDAVVAPGLGDANVIGMNLLSRLASWRVEGRTLILVPHHPQEVS
ncbi:retropepsin-like aspartic protease family protein [Novosphingobium sp. M1R2S20]|uniref:TIGR02281 family clan AA aspartic protease n=1 Tax=Novosphingobium rhizovicinum TaxID=3228928 RepID=A0ABV3R7H3_9SPHN